MSDSFDGTLLLRGEDGYEAARIDGVFNARKPERYPAAILLAAGAHDVQHGVRLATDRGWGVSVRAGGHSWAAWSLRDDVLMVDVAELRHLEYDEFTGVVAAGPATRGGLELAPFLEHRGRAFPGGHCPRVGIGGFLLQGGQGWNSRAMGWACESVVAVEAVTADGELVLADAEQNADLYWAARGAGPGFPAVVTRFFLQTSPAPEAMWHDTWTFRLDDGPALIEWLHALLPSLDRRVEPVVAATRLPEVPLRPGEARPDGTLLLLHTTCMAGSDAECAQLLDALADGPLAGRELGHVRGPTSVAEESVAQAAQNPEGHRYAVDCAWTDADGASLAPLLMDVWRSLDTEHSFSIWYGWAPTRPLPDMAFSVEGNVYVATYLIYTDAADDERYREQVHRLTGEIAQAGGTGVYLGDSDFTGRQDRFLSEAHFARLQRIRAERDPAGLFAGYLTADAEGLNIHA